MDWNQIREEKTGLSYYQGKHPSGLTVLLFPMEGYASSYALFGTNLGSVDQTFKRDTETEYTTVPHGVAHFLEHKMFEKEYGDAFSLFSRTGASANAYTSFDRTCYLFSATDKLEENLGYLLDFVQEPYFTPQTVEKEQGIIGQEIKMYDDDPGWRVYFNLLGALYQKHPVRIDIAGTVESISHITSDLLYQCYYNFYNLNNMVLSVAGNLTVPQVEQVLQQHIKPVAPVTVQRLTVEEPEEIAAPLVRQTLSVAIPLFQIGFKGRPLEGKEELRQELMDEILLEAIFGETSPFYRRLYQQGLINQNFESEIFAGRGYYALLFAGESRQPQEVQTQLLAELDRYPQGISEEAFRRGKRLIYGRQIQGFNSVENTASAMINAAFSGVGLFDSIQLLEQLTLEEVNARLREIFRPDRCALSIIDPA